MIEVDFQSNIGRFAGRRGHLEPLEDRESVPCAQTTKKQSWHEDRGEWHVRVKEPCAVTVTLGLGIVRCDFKGVLFNDLRQEMSDPEALHLSRARAACLTLDIYLTTVGWFPAC